MKKRNQPNSERTRAQRQNDPKRLRTYAMMIACGLMLVSGFFFAGRLHFSTMDFGMKNSRLRKQVDELEAEKRRLLLAREISLSPAEIKKAARKTGMIDPVALEGEVAQVASATKEKATPQPTNEIKPMVIKTAAVTAVAAAAPRVAAVFPKAERSEKPVKKAISAE